MVKPVEHKTRTNKFRSDETCAKFLGRINFAENWDWVLEDDDAFSPEVGLNAASTFSSNEASPSTHITFDKRAKTKVYAPCNPSALAEPSTASLMTATWAFNAATFDT